MKNNQRKKMSKKKLFIPSLHIPNLSKNEMIEYFHQNDVKKSIYDITFQSIKHYSKFKNIKKAELFELKEDKVVSIPRSEWKISLSSSLSYFENKQEYEKCAECRDLIKSLK